MRLRRILCILVFTVYGQISLSRITYQALRIYTKPVRFVYGKISCKQSTCQTDETESETGQLQKRKKKKGPSNESFLMFHERR